jgi:hypothetical protein
VIVKHDPAQRRAVSLTDAEKALLDAAIDADAAS